MKFAILLAFAAFAFLAQAESKTVLFGVPNMLDRGAIADYLKGKLAAAKEKLDEMLSKAQNTLKEKIEQVKNKAQHLIEQLKQKADKISDKVFETAEKLLDKIDARVAESIPQSTLKSHGIVVPTECMIMKDNFREAVHAVIRNTSACINDKIEEGESYIMDIYSRSTGAFYKINELRQEGIGCLKDVSGIKKIIVATACVAKASTKATFVATSTVPAVIATITKLIKEITTLQVDLGVCLPTNALQSLAEQVEPVIGGITECMQEKLEETLISKESTEENNEVLEKKQP